jgi:plastocyanin
MRLIPVLVALVSLITFVSFAAGTARADTVNIDAGNNYFCSSEFEGGDCTTTITMGDTVTWTISEGIHTITECEASHSSCPRPGGFNSDIIQSGATFSQTFTTAGSYPYYCELHPTDMTGTVVVQEATPSPTPAPATSATDGAASQTAMPASVPQTGGEPASAPSPPPTTLMLALGVALAVTGAGAAFAARRR